MSDVLIRDYQALKNEIVTIWNIANGKKFQIRIKFYYEEFLKEKYSDKIKSDDEWIDSLDNLGDFLNKIYELTRSFFDYDGFVGLYISSFDYIDKE